MSLRPNIATCTKRSSRSANSKKWRQLPSVTSTFSVFIARDSGSLYSYLRCVRAGSSAVANFFGRTCPKTNIRSVRISRRRSVAVLLDRLCPARDPRAAGFRGSCDAGKGADRAPRPASADLRPQTRQESTSCQLVETNAKIAFEQRFRVLKARFTKGTRGAAGVARTRHFPSGSSRSISRTFRAAENVAGIVVFENGKPPGRNIGGL